MLDVTVVNVALPDIRTSLGAGPSALQWIVDGYSTLFAALLLFGGGAADRFGHRRVFLTGLILFSGASVFCGLAGSAVLLIVGRLGQGAGAALLVPASLALLQATFPDRATRARAIALIATGLGQTMTALAAVVETAAASDAGVATAVFNVARQVGSTVGVAFFGTFTAGGSSGQSQERW